jgi:hypothetical protein
VAQKIPDDAIGETAQVQELYLQGEYENAIAFCRERIEEIKPHVIGHVYTPDGTWYTVQTQLWGLYMVMLNSLLAVDDWDSALELIHEYSDVFPRIPQVMNYWDTSRKTTQHDQMSAKVIGFSPMQRIWHERPREKNRLWLAACRREDFAAGRDLIWIRF